MLAIEKSGPITSQLEPHSKEPLTEHNPPLEAKPKRDCSRSNTIAYLQNQITHDSVCVENEGARYEVKTGWPRIAFPAEIVAAKLEK